MECSVFPCSICDLQDGSLCNADALKRDVNDIPGCPLSPQYQPQKPDIGHWVVRQPDGLFCYYDERSGKIKKRDMTLQEIILHRQMVCGMSMQHSKEDTMSQVEHQPVRWEDITR